MNNISMNQALGIWGELWQAYYKDNDYGTDTAEIYAYRLMGFDPIVASGCAGDAQVSKTEIFKVNSRVAYIKAQNSLATLLIKFESDNDCKITVNNKPIREWVETEVFDHRCHVRVARNSPKIIVQLE